MELARERLTAGDADGAAAALMPLLRHGPPSLEALRLMATVQRARGMLDEAVELTSRVLAVEPDDARSHLLRGICRRQQGRLSEALDDIARAIDLDPRLVTAHFELALAREDAGRKEEAVESYRAAIALAPTFAQAHYNLGLLMAELGEHADAAACYRAALEHAPGYAPAMTNLGCVLRALGSSPETLAEIEALHRQAVEIDPDFTEAWNNLAATLHELGRRDEAIGCYRKVLELDPQHADANRVLPALEHVAAAARGETIPNPSTAYIANLFDDYAQRYDGHLVNELGYRGHVLIAELVAPLHDEPFGDALDLGCGTGLLGEQMRSSALRWTGVDLSPKMIERAKERGVYQRLVVASISEFLAADDGAYDLITAADVFVYCGDLKDIIELSGRRLRPGGWLAFSTEAHDGDGYVLRSSGRYAHARPYVERLSKQAGLVREEVVETVIRWEHGEPVRGELHLFGRPRSKA